MCVSAPVTTTTTGTTTYTAVSYQTLVYNSGVL